MCLRFGDNKKGKDMKIVIRCATHNHVHVVYSSYTSNGEVVIDVVPCPQCATQRKADACPECGEPFDFCAMGHYDVAKAQLKPNCGEPDENYQRFLADVHEREERTRQ